MKEEFHAGGAGRRDVSVAVCSRSDGLDCRTAQRAPLASRMTNSSLAGIRLQAWKGAGWR